MSNHPEDSAVPHRRNPEIGKAYTSHDKLEIRGRGSMSEDWEIAKKCWSGGGGGGPWWGRRISLLSLRDFKPHLQDSTPVNKDFRLAGSSLLNCFPAYLYIRPAAGRQISCINALVNVAVPATESTFPIEFSDFVGFNLHFSLVCFALCCFGLAPAISRFESLTRLRLA